MAKEITEKFKLAAFNIIAAKSKYTAWRIASILVTGVLAALVILTIYFIYQNIYNTLSNTNAIVILSSNIDDGIIDITTYEEAKRNIKRKQAELPNPDSVRNIFFYGNEITSFNNTSTKH